MTFQPRMTSRLEGITVIDELVWRSWAGAVADVWHASGSAGASGEYVSPDARLFVVLDHEGGDIALRLAPKAPLAARLNAAAHLSFIPADVPVWSQIEKPMRVRHLDLHFDVEGLRERIGTALDPNRLTSPRLAFSEPGLLALARLIAEECGRGEGWHDLYGEGLILALFVELLQIGRPSGMRRSALAAWQLRRATAFIEDNCLRTIRLQELADLTGLSQSYFSHAFKAATGEPPHQWQMKARMRHVKDMLTHVDRPLTEIAAAAGFADQAHLTRMFRRLVGTTPAAWRRDRNG